MQSAARYAFQFALKNELLITNVADVARMFGIYLYAMMGNPGQDALPSARAMWDVEANTLLFLGVNAGISVNFYTLPISGARCDN